MSTLHLCVSMCGWMSHFFKRVHDVRYKITDTPRLEMETWSRQECWAPGCHKLRTQEKPETSSRASSFLPTVLSCSCRQTGDKLSWHGPRSPQGPHHLPKPHRTFPEERDEPSPLSEVWKEASPVAPSIPLFSLSSAIRPLPPSSRGLLTCPLHQAVQKPSILILGAFSSLTSQQARTPHTTPQDPLLLLQGERLSVRGVSGSARPPAGPGPTLLQAAALPETKGPK